MKRILWKIDNQPSTLYATIKTWKPEQVVVVVRDAGKKHSNYSKQETIVTGIETFEIPMPLAPAKAFFEVFTRDPNAHIDVALRAEPLTVGAKCGTELSDPTLRNFLKFWAWFSENAGVLSSAYGNYDSSVYQSPDRKFEVRYKPYIIDEVRFVKTPSGLMPNANYGKLSPVSFRVRTNTKSTGVIHVEASKHWVQDYTIPGRMVLGVHELSHEYLSVDPDDEEEADKHAIRICRCLGFGKREIANGFLEVFARYRSEENQMRTDKVMKLIKALP